MSRLVVVFSVLFFLMIPVAATRADQPPVVIPITGKSIDALAGLDVAIVKLIAKHDLPGISIAISDNGRLIHSRGYGYANRESEEAVSPVSRFRIASISKPITAVAVLQLVEMGKLRLDDRVFEILDAPEPIENAPFADPRLADVTIKQLLQHRGGWDRDKSFDPMFRSVKWAEMCRCGPPAMPNDIIRAMHSQSLDFDPGSRYAYSNYGYCLLGRVIEKVSGQGYQDFVDVHIKRPLGITSMQLGKTRRDDRQVDEVCYYHPDDAISVFASDLGEKVASPYGAWCLEAMDAHGGWIATAEDLIRFIDAIPFAVASTKSRPNSISILSRDSARLILARPVGHAEDADSFYGLGWTIRPDQDQSFTVWHTGSLPGTATELTRRSDGRCFALLINSRHGNGGKNPLNEVTGAIHRSLSKLGQMAAGKEEN